MFLLLSVSADQRRAASTAASDAPTTLAAASFACVPQLVPAETLLLSPH